MTGLATPLVAGSGLDDTFDGIMVRASRIVWGADGARVCLIDDAGGATPDMRDAIIRAVNAHDALVAACEEAFEYACNLNNDQELIDLLDSALALARGESDVD